MMKEADHECGLPEIACHKMNLKAPRLQNLQSGRCWIVKLSSCKRADTSNMNVHNDLSFPRAAEHLTWAQVLIAQGRPIPTGHPLHDVLRLLEWQSRG